MNFMNNSGYVQILNKDLRTAWAKNIGEKSSPQGNFDAHLYKFENNFVMTNIKSKSISRLLFRAAGLGVGGIVGMVVADEFSHKVFRDEALEGYDCISCDLATAKIKVWEINGIHQWDTCFSITNDFTLNTLKISSEIIFQQSGGVKKRKFGNLKNEFYEETCTLLNIDVKYDLQEMKQDMFGRWKPHKSFFNN